MDCTEAEVQSCFSGSAMTLTQRIVEALRSAALDDDQLAAQLGVVRQQINQTCRALEKRGVLSRGVGPGAKIVNRLPGSSAFTDRGSSPGTASTDRRRRVG